MLLLSVEAFWKFFKSERVKSSEGAYENKFVCRTCNNVLSSTADPVHSGVMFTRTRAGGGAVANIAPGQHGHGGGLVQSILSGTSATIQKEAIIKASLGRAPKKWGWER